MTPIGTPILPNNLNFIHNHNTFWGTGVGPGCFGKHLHAVHVALFYHPFLALAERHVRRDWICTAGSSTGPRIATGASDGLEGGMERIIFRRRARRTSEYGVEPGSKEREDHRQIGRDHCDEGLFSTPGTGKLCAVDRVLVGG